MAPTTLRLGDRNPRVAQLQHALTGAGYPFPATGVYCRATEDRVRGWQEAQGMQATGVADAATWAVLVG